MLKKLVFILFFAITLFSCNTAIVESKYESISSADWDKDHVVSFSFNAPDTINRHDLFLNIRNDETYPYSNLFLITELDFPNGQTVKDTLEYEMALPSGEWMGQGNGSLKENKLWYKENIVFPSSGVYTLQITHAMRKNGNVEGDASLTGVTDVGFQIEKTNK